MNTEMYKKGISYNEAKNILINKISNGILLKSRDGEEARLSLRSIGKLISNAAVNKSIANGFSREQHYAFASNIDNLFINSIKLFEHLDKNCDHNVKAMHRFCTLLFGNNFAYITIKESTEHGKRIYTIELVEMGKLEGILEEAKKNRPLPPLQTVPLFKYIK